MSVESANSSAGTLSWNYTDPVLRPGETIPFAFSNGSGPYTTDAFGIGVFDDLNLEYTPPVNQSPLVHDIGASDDNGNVGTNSVRIAGFQDGNRIGFPLSFGDQNFPSGMATTANNDIYVASVISDSPGWERWVVFKSTDNGETFSKVDQYVPYEWGESHPLGMVANGNDLYVCGYSWGPSGIPEWNIRKTSNGGSTWSDSDLLQNPAASLVCYDMDKSVSGNLYAVGYDDSIGGLIRESTDNGATWNTILSTGAVTYFSAVKLSPAGVLWALSNTGDIYKGTYAAGSWNFVVAGTALAVGGGPYELDGDLEVISETEAILSYGTGGFWQLQVTSDGGATWTSTYTSPSFGSGHGVKRLSTGEIIATGYLTTTPRTMLIQKSIDNGATWTQVYSDNTLGRSGVNLIEANDTSVRAIGYEWSDPNQIVNLKSVDAGDSWTDSDKIIYRENLYDYLTDFKTDGAGNLWAVGSVSFIDDTLNDPWVTVKSSDNGVTWTESDVFTDVADDFGTNCIGGGPANEIYVAGSVNWVNHRVRKSSDSGTSWTDVDSGAFPCSHMTVAPNGNVYFLSTSSGNIREGSLSGTVWADTAVTFPVEPGHTGYSPKGLKAMSDGSLWISLVENDTVPTSNHVIYKSLDGGDTFTEVLRETGSITRQKFFEASNGDIYAISVGGIKRTTDSGVTWTDVYDETLWGNTLDFAFDSNQRIYIMNDNDQIIAQNQFTGSFFLSFDYPLYNTLDYAYIDRFVDCNASSGLCLLVHYDVSVLGSVSRFMPFIVP